MYIAFRWLLSMVFAMWIGMCGVDIYFKGIIGKESGGFQGSTKNITVKTHDYIESSYENPLENLGRQTSSKRNYSFLLMMIGAGCLTVLLYNRKKDVILFTKRKVYDLKKSKFLQTLKIHFENAARSAIRASVAGLNYYTQLWEITVSLFKKSVNLFLSYKILKKQPIKSILLQKLKEAGDERNNLSQLLIAAIHENKNIRTQYQLQFMAKNRLARYIENTNKANKENRSRYVNFQQLYLMTHQENTFLKARIKKLSKEKLDAEKSLLDIMNEIYKSKNSELKAFCSRFIVKTKDNLMNSDAGAEIQKFLERSRKYKVPGYGQYIESSAGDSKPVNNWTNCISVQFQDDSLAPLVSDAPKLKGLPGEYVWTVKDKDGIIDKLYEYDYESDFDNGEAIKRIRQYSVYYDKDCILDISSETSLVEESNTGYQPWGKPIYVGNPITSQGFLTGSDAFQEFLRNNTSIGSRTSAPPLTNG